jgi:hypothetical protein
MPGPDTSTARAIAAKYTSAGPDVGERPESGSAS